MCLVLNRRFLAGLNVHYGTSIWKSHIFEVASSEICFDLLEPPDPVRGIFPSYHSGLDLAAISPDAL